MKKLYKTFNAERDLSGFDHLVIGSGIGGLTVATFLAKAGEKVAVLERHYVPGGFLHSFKRTKGFKWDVGVHYIGNVQEGSPLRKLFDLLTSKKLDWEWLGEVYDVVYIEGDRYEFRAGKEEFRAQMLQYFPEEQKAIDAYLKLVERTVRWAGAFFFEKTFEPFLSRTIGTFIRKRFERYSQRTTKEVLDSLTDNPRLKAVLSAQCGNYGLSPKSSSFAAHASVVNHFMKGGFYPKGGPDRLCKHTLETLNANGGQVFVRADVQEILTEKNRVKGVRVGDRFIPCKSVISNAGVKNTFTRLLPNGTLSHCKSCFEKARASTGHLCLYVGLDRSDAALELPKHNIWSFESEDLDDTMDRVTLENAPEKFAYISFPSSKDPEWKEAHPGKATIQALTIGRYEWFEKYEGADWKKRGQEYEDLKKAFEERMLAKLYRLFPQIKGHVEVTEVSTPLSTKHFANYQHGEIYGLEHDPSRFKLPHLRPQTEIRGLRVTGQDITLVGVSGAMLAGVLCSISILKFRIWRIFREIARMDKKA